MRLPTNRPTGWTRFQLGDFVCTVVTDGYIEGPPGNVIFPYENSEFLLEEHHKGLGPMRLNQNILIVDTGSHTVMFDTGTGDRPEFQGVMYPNNGRQMPTNLRAAGIAFEDIDVVALTHLHGDHSWGLTEADGTIRFPHARVAASAVELDYYTGPELPEDADADPTVRLQLQKRAAQFNVAPYRERGRVLALQDGDEVVPGIEAVLSPGHTPGSMVYRITSQGETLVVWGDMCHSEILLLPFPDRLGQFDHDPEQARDCRVRTMAQIYENREAVLAYHFPFPGLGHIRKDGDGYQWVPSWLEFEVPEHLREVIPHEGPAIWETR